MADSEATAHRLEPSLLPLLTWLVYFLLRIQGAPPLQNLTGFRCFVEPLRTSRLLSHLQVDMDVFVAWGTNVRVQDPAAQCCI